MALEKPAAEPKPTAQVVSYEDDEEAKAGVDIWKYVFGFTEMAVVKCAIDLGIADAMASHPEPSISLSQLSSELGCCPSSLRRILRFLVHRKIFRHHADADAYSQTPLSRRLLTRGENSMAAFILLESTPVMLAPWLNLSSHVAGASAGAPPPFVTAHGDDVWAYSVANPGHSRLIDDAMACHARAAVPALAEDCPEVFEGVLTVVDVGGGNGTALRLLRKAFPWIRGINFDLPHVVAGALPPCEGVVDVGGDMFQGVPKADAAFLMWVLHDWSDSECVQILKNCREAISESKSGKVIIAEAVIGEEEDGKLTGARLALDMVMMAHTSGGKERTEKDWAHVLRDAGFAKYTIKPVRAIQSIIEAFP
ncbi:acetylserotonin O-methyltransferase-like [Syzygium oleosum]|uniref:acetylserotonin O-methyltransferase-like n=1 Tax=Syzygium oleosum TaxID=219896 RepID=UPI0011D214DF|nr:acetylserotonin O-methyltransferase-like [Syzygium oleosum]